MARTKLYVVTAIDHGDSADGKPRALGIFKTRKEAVEFTTLDIEQWADDHVVVDENGYTYPVMVDFEKFSAGRDEFLGCEWNIDEIEADV